jgi:hypothetical protein
MHLTHYTLACYAQQGTCKFTKFYYSDQAYEDLKGETHEAFLTKISCV